MISMIAAIGENKALGIKNKLPWNIPEDTKWFRGKTNGKVVITGRKTYESIGFPLPKRTNIIVTRDPNYEVKGCIVVHSLEKAIKKAQELTKEEIFIIGGGQIYKLGMKCADKLYITVIKGNFEADTYFPDYSEFSNVIFKKESRNEEFEYTFYILERE